MSNPKVQGLFTRNMHTKYENPIIHHFYEQVKASDRQLDRQDEIIPSTTAVTGSLKRLNPHDSGIFIFGGNLVWSSYS